MIKRCNNFAQFFLLSVLAQSFFLILFLTVIQTANIDNSTDEFVELTSQQSSLLASISDVSKQNDAANFDGLEASTVSVTETSVPTKHVSDDTLFLKSNEIKDNDNSEKNNKIDVNNENSDNYKTDEEVKNNIDLNIEHAADLFALSEDGGFASSSSDAASTYSVFDDNNDGEMKLNAVREETLELPQINYASKECLAKVLYANEEAVNKGSVLVERDNDFYLRNPCERATNKFLIVELCEFIRPTMFEIANFEFFSSNPKHIRLSVGEVYPTLEWTVVAEFAAEDTHEVQRFPISSPETFVKFLKVELISHYGSEYYCTLSFLRVFGVSKLDSVNHELPSLFETTGPNAIAQLPHRQGEESSINAAVEDFSFQLPPSLQHLLDCFQCSATAACQNTRNYAAKECGANVLFANPEAVNKEGVLYDKDLDFYLRNPCEKAQEKFLILRLCESVQPTKIEIANFEYFSSGPKNVRLSVSKTYPTNEWTVVGEFEVQNTRETQCFPIFPIGSYVKFIKLELLSHYGSEYYCTLSFLRIYGISKIDEYEDEPMNISKRRNKSGSNHSEDEVYVLKWFIGVILSVFAIFVLNRFC